MLSTGCRPDRDALRAYLAEDHPRLTASVPAILGAYDDVIVSEEDVAKRLEGLEMRVVRPYAAVVEGLAAYEGSSEGVRRHHTAYLAAAQRQLQVFRETASALQRETDLSALRAALGLVRGDLDRWVSDVTSDAHALGVRLVPAERQ